MADENDGVPIEPVVDAETVSATEVGESSAETIKTDEVIQPGSEDKKPVPYSRFQETIQEKNEHKAEAVKLREANLKLIEQIASINKPAQDNTAPTPEMLFGQKYVTPVVERAVQPLLDEIKALRTDGAKENLKTTLAALKVTYPKMDRDEVLNIIANNPDNRALDIKTLAKDSHDKYHAIGQAAVDAYVAGKGENAKHPGGVPKGGAPSIGQAQMPKGLTTEQKFAWTGAQALARLNAST